MNPQAHQHLFDIEQLFGASFENDLKGRAHPDVLTSLLTEQVPVLGFVQWRVAGTKPGYTRSILPLVHESTNQHCTHQAALLILAADYTGGIALGSLFPGWPVIGVHAVSTRSSVALWLVKVEIKYLRPSTTELEVVAEIDPKRHFRIARRFAEGRPVLESIPIKFYNKGVLVAEATLTYLARQSEKLRTDGASSEKVNILFEHKLVSAAELIAGVRAAMNGTLYNDPYAPLLAGEHGLALAERFLRKSPQLGGMVAARTQHLDNHITAFVANGMKLIFLGVGYDTRPFRLRLPPGTVIYELDLPTMLNERGRALAGAGAADIDGIQRIGIPADLRTTCLREILKDHIDPNEPVFVAWEGSTMYFEEHEVRKILLGVRSIFGNRASRLWADFVDHRAIAEPDVFPEVRAFMDGMKFLGEPFIFGPPNVNELFAENSFDLCEYVSSGSVLKNSADPVYGLYGFFVASACNSK
jgi:methyltransferase (TIGR00027 family)